MSVLFPLYALVGLLALGIPVYLHLQRRPPSDTVAFSSLRFLKPARQVRINRRSRLEHLALLALRCLALLLLALMFSRPFMKDPKALGAAEGHRSVWLVDTSASMRRRGLWEQLETRIDTHLKALDPARDRISILSFHDQTRALLRFESWDEAPPDQRIALARAALEGLEPTWRGSQLGRALVEASDRLQDDASEQTASVLVLSDFQQGAELDALTGSDWPPDVALLPERVGPEEVPNASLHRLPGRRSRLRLVNQMDAATELSLAWAGSTNRQAITLEAGQARVLPLPDAPAHRASGGELVLAGDTEGFDNHLFIAPRAALPIHLQYLGPRSPENPDHPFFYFLRAFPETGDLAPRFLPAASFPEDPARADLLVIADALDKPALDAVRRELVNGRNALMVLPSVRAIPTLASLLGGEIRAVEERPEAYALLEDIDFDHPALGAFREPSVRDFTKIHVWRYRKLNLDGFPEGTRVVARFDSGDPAWLDVPVGDGHLILMASGWHPRDSQLARSSKFLPLCFSLLEYAGRNTDLETSLVIGDPLPWFEHLQTERATLTGPGGLRRTLQKGDTVTADQPGLYRLVSGERTVTYAANLPASESRLEPIAADRFRSLGIPFGQAAVAQLTVRKERREDLVKTELEAKQKLWRFVVLGLFLILLVETYLGSRAEGEAVDAVDALP